MGLVHPEKKYNNKELTGEESAITAIEKQTRNKTFISIHGQIIDPEGGLA
jgi:hypothetical protein